MGNDGLDVGVEIRKYAIITTKMLYRSVCSHPFVVGILLMLLFLYRSSPFIFSLFVSASPVLVCTAVLLGILLSFGGPNDVPNLEVKNSYELGLSKSNCPEDTVIVGENEFCSRNSKCTDLKRDLVESGDDEPLVDNSEELDNIEKHHDGDAGFSLMHTEENSREVIFENKSVEQVKSEEVENTKIERTLDLGDQLFRMGVDAGLSHSDEKVQNEQKGEYSSVDESVDRQIGNNLETFMESKKNETFEDYISAEGSLDVHMGDQLEPSLASWQQFDGLDGAFSSSHEFQHERFEDYKSGEGLSEAQLRDYLESSMRSWKPLSSDHDDEDDESDSGSDGAESSSPDASMADIIPMLDELHPLLNDEIPQTSNLSRHSSTAVDRSVKSSESSVHSEDESYHKEEEEGDGKSDVDDENEEETQGRKDDPAKSAIMWTEDDQKNLMDLGTSELERNHRLESLIARRRARKMMADSNLIDFDGMDLPFPVAPIATRKQNPFDYPLESYDDLGLPPVPGSAPSIMLNRRNPFDLPYDSSEEKPDLTGDSFQQEFMEITRREAVNQREAMFRRNETFSMGSSAFDFVRPSRFRPYFVPERTDSDGMSYSSLQSLQRQFSELSESKASSVAETESTSVAADQEEKKQIEHDFAQEAEPSSEIDQASALVQRESQSSKDLDSLSCQENEEKKFVLHESTVELGGSSSSAAAAAYTSEIGRSGDHRLPYKKKSSATESWRSYCEESHGDIHLIAEFIEVKHNTTSSSLSVPKDLDENKLEDVDSCLVNMEQKQFNDVMNVDMSMNSFLEPVVSDVTMEQALDASVANHAIEVESSHQKEPIYDLSPLKKNHSLSSDLQRKSSGTDLYHLSDELFMVDVSNAHSEIAENISLSTGQDPNGNRLTVDKMVEDSMLDMNELFSELKQLPDSSLASGLAEDESDMNLDSSDRKIKDLLFDSKASSNKVEQIFVRRDDIETHDEIKQDSNIRVDDMSTSDGREFVEDFISAQEKKDLALLADDGFSANSILSCSQVESINEVGMKMEVNQQQFQALSSILVSPEGDGNELLSSVDGNQIFLHQSDFHDPWADLAKQEPEHDKTFASQRNLTFSYHEEKSIADLAIKEHLDDPPETRHEYIVDENHEISEGFVIDELTLNEKKNDVKVMDEALLSELDVVGDFRVLDVVPNIANSMTYSTTPVDSTIPSGIINEIHLSTEMPFEQKTYLADATVVGKSEYDTGTITAVETMDPNLDLHTENVTTGLLVLEAQFVDDIDAGLMKVREDDHKSVVVEPVCTEFTGKEEIALSETGLVLSEAEVEGASIPRTIQYEHPLLEGNKLDSDRRETDPRILLLNAEIFEQSCVNADEVVDRVDTADVEVLKTAAVTGVGSMEFEPSLIQREIKKIEKTSFIETSATPTPEPRDHSDSDVTQVNRDVEQIDDIPIVDSNTESALESRDQGQDVGSMEFEISPIDGDSEAIGITPSAAPVLVSNKQAVNAGSMEFESSQIDGDTKEINKTLLFEASTAPALQSRDETSLVEASFMAPDPQSTNLSEGVGFVELNSLHTDGDTEEINNKIPLDAASTAPALEPEGQAEDVGSMELKSLQVDKNINEKQEPSALETGNSVGSEYGIETLEMPVLVAGIAPIVEPEYQGKRITSEPESKRKQVSNVDGTSVVSVLKSDSWQSDREVTDSLKFPADEEIIAPPPEFKNQKGIVGSSELLQLDTKVPKVQESPAVEAGIPFAHEPEEEKEMVGYLESQQLQLSRGIEELQDWHVVEESIPLVMSEDQTKRAVPSESESLQMHTDIIEKHSRTQANIASVPMFENETMKVNHNESKPLVIDKSLGEVELFAVEPRDARAFVSEGHLERVGSVESQQLQMDRYSKEIQGSPVLKINYESDCRSEDEMAINSLMGGVGVQASQEHQLVSEQHSEVDASNAIDATENNGYHQPL